MSFRLKIPETMGGGEEAFTLRALLGASVIVLEALNENPDAKPEEMLANVKKHMDAFIGEADQFDDITMLGFVYYGSAENKGE